MTRLVVVGGGLSGLFSAFLAAGHGAEVTLVAEGRGGLALSSGRIEVWGEGRPMAGLTRCPPGHPYRRVTEADLRQAVQALVDLVAAEGLTYDGTLDRNTAAPTAAGPPRPAALLPVAQSPRALGPEATVALAGLQGFRDFAPHLARGIGASSRRVTLASYLTSPLASSQRDVYSTDLARWFDQHDDLGSLTEDWRQTLGDRDVVVLPAVLGLARHAEVLHAVQAELRMQVIEIPTLPPSVPGLRLETALRRAGQRAGVRFVEGSHAVGRVAGRGRRRLADGVAALTKGGMRLYPADVVILATGGPLHGGWEAQPDGTARDSVFSLPIATGAAGEWTAARFADRQPYAPFGLKVDPRLRPLGKDGRPVFENVFAVGGVLAGADRAAEGSRQGIDLATAFRAATAALA